MRIDVDAMQIEIECNVQIAEFKKTMEKRKKKFLQKHIINIIG